MKHVDTLFSYRTMRAVQQLNESQNPDRLQLPARRSLWARWKAFVYRNTDRLVG